MSNNEISLETRASSAYVQGRLIEAMLPHADCECSLDGEVEQIINEWKQAEAELKALPKVELFPWRSEVPNEDEK